MLVVPRIGRSAKHLVDLINDFQENAINFVSINENIDTTTAMGEFVFTIFSGLAQFDYGQGNVPTLTYFLPLNDKKCTSK